MQENLSSDLRKSNVFNIQDCVFWWLYSFIFTWFTCFHFPPFIKIIKTSLLKLKSSSSYFVIGWDKGFRGNTLWQDQHQKQRQPIRPQTCVDNIVQRSRWWSSCDNRCSCGILFLMQCGAIWGHRGNLSVLYMRIIAVSHGLLFLICVVCNSASNSIGLIIY